MVIHNDAKFSPSFNISMTIDSLAEESRPTACVACGKCAKTCPQKIDVPAAMKEFSEILETLPHWADMCRQREEESRRLREERRAR